MNHGFDVSIPVGHWVGTEQEARQWLEYFSKSHEENDGLGLDTETSGLDRIRDRVIVWSLSDGKERICMPQEFIPLYKEPILENPAINFDLTNVKFDGHMLANSGADITKAGELRDTVVQSWLYNENNQGRHGLKECITDHFGRTTPTFEQTFGKTIPAKKDRKTGRIITPGKTVGDLIRESFADAEKRLKAADYSSLDSYNSTSLRCYFDDVLDGVNIHPGRQYTLADYFYDVEVPFTKVLLNMERRGITVDRGHLVEQQGPMERDMERIQREFTFLAARYDPAHGVMNLNSTNDIRWFFFDCLQKQVVKWTDGGNSGKKQPSTDSEVLELWAGQGDEWAQKLLEYRGIAKIHGTYVMGLMNWLDPMFRIHTSLNQTGTVTGRLSSSDPNLQNIPRPGDDKFKIREAFTHGDDMVLVVADYEQLEMRLMAHFSQDQKMINAIKQGVDLHCLTVAEMYGIPYDDVMAAKQAEKDFKKGKRQAPLTEREEKLLFYRQAAKATGFGIIYGIGGEHLAANLTRELKRLVTEDEGYDLIRKWYAVFPGVKRYIDETKERLWREGYVQVCSGRLRRFGDLKGMSKRDAKQCERQAVNSIIQGTAAEIAKRAMIMAENDPELKSLGARLLLQIHDELIFECNRDPEIVKKVKARAKFIMENTWQFLVPLPAEIGHGETWNTAK